MKNSQVGSKFCQILNNPLKIAKYFLHSSKVAKYRQIWSHWSCQSSCRPTSPFRVMKKAVKDVVNSDAATLTLSGIE